MADATSDPEPPPQEPPADSEARALIVRALEYVEAGRRLPRPNTWNELLAGMVVWLGEHWSDDAHVRRACGNCGSADWEVGPVVSFDSDPRWPVPPDSRHGSFPYFQVGCRSCGSTLLINALLVFEPQAPARPDSTPES